MENNSNAVTAPKVDTQDAISDRYEVQTNITPEPEKVEDVKKVETEVKSDSQPEPSGEPQESKAINPRTQARKAEKERLIRENAAMAERLKQLETKPQTEQPEGKKPKDLSKEPQIEDYDDAIEWSRDIAKYEAVQAFNEQTSKATQQKQLDAYNESLDIVKADKPDFDEKVNALVQSNLVTPDIEEAILSSDLKAGLSYHLAQYGGDLMALRGLPKELLPKAIKEIEAFIKKGGEQTEKPRVTQASPPITPPGNSAKTNRSVSSYSKQEIEDMPLAEFNKLNK